MSAVTDDAGPIFVDTADVNARVNRRDRWHDVAIWWEARMASDRRRLVTTEFVLIEIADGLAAIRRRSQAVAAIEVLQASSLIEIVPASSELFATALKLYRNRGDKNWGLTDCASFVVMDVRRLTEALTTDEHFQQAGFRALLLEERRG